MQNQSALNAAAAAAATGAMLTERRGLLEEFLVGSFERYREDRSCTREKVSALCAMGIGESDANDGIGAPITVPVTACATTGVTRAR